MRGKSILIGVGVAVTLAALATAAAISAQDRYALKVPGGLAFSEFRGYDDWHAISISHNGDMLAVILGNPEMIAAFKSGAPRNGKPFPDGAKNGENSLERAQERDRAGSAICGRYPA
jgi:hypothetical protein